jgi:predicted dehydrogenase
MSPKGLKAGVVGAGVFGGHHALKYAALGGVDLVAIYDVDYPRAEALARRLGAAAYPNFKGFLDAVDLVTVATPASAHFSVARQALEAGRHVLIEKPIALRLSHADRLIQLSRERRLVLQVGHQERFVFEAFGLLDRTVRPRSISCVRRNPMTGRGEDVSVVFDLMIHDIDLVRSLGLCDPVSAAAIGDDDELDARLVFRDGATVAFEASRLARERERRMTIEYDDGAVEIDFISRSVANTTGRPHKSFDNAAAHPAFADPLGYGVARFVEAAVSGGLPAVSGEDGRDALEWALMVEQAAADAMRPAARQSVRA